MTTGVGATHSNTGEIDMGCETNKHREMCLDRSCLEQVRQGLPSSCTSSGTCTSCSVLWRVTSTCDGVSQTQHVIKKLGLALHCLVSPPSGAWSTYLDVCGFAQAKRTWLPPSAHKDKKEIEHMYLEREHTQLAVRSCSASRWKSCSCRRSL